MNIIRPYLRPYNRLIILALLLASVNQVFSLLDPYIVGEMINNFTDMVDPKSGKTFDSGAFISMVMFFVGLAIGAAMVSRIAKNFQDYYVNVITQKVGTDIYTAGIKHTLGMPYQLFEDQRSGETLGRLQKVKNRLRATHLGLC